MGRLSAFSTVYQAKWQLLDEKPLVEAIGEEAYESITNITIIMGDRTPSIKVEFSDGTEEYISISKDCKNVIIGSTVDKEKCFFVTLKRGDAICEKINIK